MLGFVFGDKFASFRLGGHEFAALDLAENPLALDPVHTGLVARVLYVFNSARLFVKSVKQFFHSD